MGSISLRQVHDISSILRQPAKIPANTTDNIFLDATIPQSLNLDVALRQAIAHHQAGRLQDAERLYRAILQSQPNHPEANHNLGVIAVQMNQPAVGLPHLKTALETNPNQDQYWLSYIDLLVQTGQINAAREALEQGRQYGLRGAAVDALAERIQNAPNIEPSPQEINALMALYTDGQYSEAATFALAMTERFPLYVLGWKVLGGIFQQMGRVTDALASMQHVVALSPNDSETHNNLGYILQESNRLPEAEAAYIRALELNPGDADAHYNLGTLLEKMKRLPEAEVSYLRALELNPCDAEAHNNLAYILQESNRLPEAEAAIIRALELNPNFAEAHNNLGVLRQKTNRIAEAEASYRQALKLKPDFADAHYSLGSLHHEMRRQPEAEAAYRRALELNPDFAEARWKLAMNTIPTFVDAYDEIKIFRANFLRELAELNKWFDDNRVALGYKAVGTAQPFFIAYQEESNPHFLSEYGALCARLMKHWQDGRTPPTQGGTNRIITHGRAIRVGIVSAYLHNHSEWDAIVKGWFQHLNRDRIELHVFHVGAKQDSVTDWVKSQSTSFEQGSKDLSQWVDAILEKQTDILIYPGIGMNQMTVKLASLRLAPIQIAAWGHPETTGLPTIDYYLSAEYFDSPDSEINYTEKLVRLPHLGCHYQALQVTSVDPDFASLNIVPDVPLILCPGAPFKYAPQYDWVFTDIARKLGKCQIIFFTSDLNVISDKLHRRLTFAFSRSNLNFNDYCVFIPWQEKSIFYGLMKRADVFLDTIGFSGFNTAMQAVECGLPIVTREGRFMRGRLASGILKRMGVTELIANTEEEYVNLAVQLAQDKEYQRNIRQRIASSRNVLFNDVEPVRALEDFLINSVKYG